MMVRFAYSEDGDKDGSLNFERAQRAHPKEVAEILANHAKLGNPPPEPYAWRYFLTVKIGKGHAPILYGYLGKKDPDPRRLGTYPERLEWLLAHLSPIRLMGGYGKGSEIVVPGIPVRVYEYCAKFIHDQIFDAWWNDGNPDYSKPTPRRWG